MQIIFYDSYRFPYPSQNITLHTVIQTDSFPTGLAVDLTNDHIYWVHLGSQRLLRCNIDGSNMTVLSTFRYPWVIRLDVTNRWIYIVERDFGVLKSTFDLAHQQTIVNFTSSLIYCMDIDTEEQRLFWINNDGDMKSAKDDGSDVKTIYSTYDRRDYPALDVFGSYIYYDHTNRLSRISKTPGSTPTVLYTDTSRIDSIFVFKQTGM
ncbi:Hypothetical predicted protein [Mytilus galloprovincialis]|uniref:Uncharacterized protein n=1 Tax=Mytilus galloprovincialis TaxID=29158 RepID=A0A8B6CH44_MYTGA|nr:Hypothetical predicted protein [Mytilus galloprovincialis]